MSTPYRREFERLRHWTGQTLRAADLRDQARFDALYRQLHNRTLHAIGGVAFGLEVAIPADALGMFEVACGVAYDANGRELVLQRPRRVPRPAQPSWLLMRRRVGPVETDGCRTADAGCRPDDAQLMEAEVELLWSPLAGFERLAGVTLARFDGARLDEAFVRPQARPLAKPRLARGETVAGDTPWEPWEVDEPDGQGGVRRKVVGVQTHIDTSAAGFTSTPCYVASIQANGWNFAGAEFSPAFFPNVADASVERFTFRLLLAEIARRRYDAWFGSARVTAVARRDRVVVDLDAAPFKPGDAVAQLRPRADSVVVVQKSASTKLTLSLPLADAVAGTSLLAVGNLPRAARVIALLPEDPAVVAAFNAPFVVRKSDVLMRTADGALAVVDRVAQGTMTVSQPFPGWKATDALTIARLSPVVTVQSATAGAGKMTLVLKPATHTIAAGMTIVLLDQTKSPLATGTVSNRSGASIDVAPPLDGAGLAALKRVAAFEPGLTISSVQAKKQPVVEMDTVECFEVGDIVAAADDASRVATVAAVRVNKKELELDVALSLAADAILVAANWRCATSVMTVDPVHPERVTVGRVDAVPPGAFVARREEGGFGSPVPVMGTADGLVTLRAPIVGLARLDTLAVGVFPRTVTVVSQDAQEEQVLVAEAGRLAVGESVMLVPDPGGAGNASAVVQVAAVAGNTIVLSDSLGKLTAGQRLASVQWRDRVLLTSVDAGNAARIEVDRDVDFRPGDVVGRLTRYADCSDPGFVEAVNGAQLTLRAVLANGDGIVDGGWIDGGILGPAAVGQLSPPTIGVPAAQFQPLVRMHATDGLEMNRPCLAYGFDQLTGGYVAHSAYPIVFGAAAELVYLANATDAYRYRPETLSLITSFNTDFPRAFATFAQKQQLVVRWIGCQQEFTPVPNCPAQEPWDPCVQDRASEE